MKLTITDIEFDLPRGVPVPDVIGQSFEADDESDLADVIADKTGWCVKSISATGM